MPRFRDFFGVEREERRALRVDRVVRLSTVEMGSTRKSALIGISSSEVGSSSEESYNRRETAILEAKVWMALEGLLADSIARLSARLTMVNFVASSIPSPKRDMMSKI
jgi:hypothetical protein